MFKYNYMKLRERYVLQKRQDGASTDLIEITLSKTHRLVLKDLHLWFIIIFSWPIKSNELFWKYENIQSRDLSRHENCNIFNNKIN